MARHTPAGLGEPRSWRSVGVAAEEAAVVVPCKHRKWKLRAVSLLCLRTDFERPQGFQNIIHSRRERLRHSTVEAELLEARHGPSFYVRIVGQPMAYRLPARDVAQSEVGTVVAEEDGSALLELLLKQGLFSGSNIRCTGP